MNLYKNLLLITGFILTTTAIMAQDLDKIIQRHIQAMGIDKVKEIRTYSMSGNAEMSGMSGPVKQMIKMPDKVKMVIDINGQKIIQVISGTQGWMIVPMAGTTEPVPMNASQVKVLSRQASLEGLLYGWKEKGLEVSFAGEENIMDELMYKIKVMEEGEQASITYLYIDKDTYMLRAQKDVSYMSGQEVITMTYFKSYKEVSGINFPTHIESKMNGQIVMDLTIDKVEVNQDIPDEVFTKP